MRFIYILILALVFLFGCQKEKNLEIWGKWVLVDGEIYVENLETYEKIKYKHFGDGKTVSSMNAFSPPNYDIEKLEQNVTTWEFKPEGEFILNGDYEHPMGIDIGEYNKTIIEHPTADEPDEIRLGGSARPFQAYTYDYDAGLIIVIIHEKYEVHNGYNHTYHNELIFREVK
jgi:hypothetical protein